MTATEPRPWLTAEGAWLCLNCGCYLSKPAKRPNWGRHIVEMCKCDGDEAA